MRAVGLLFGAVLLVARPSPGQQPVDTVLARIERRATSGDRAAARALADSLLATLTPASDQYAEALFWRAFTSPSAAEAERDYLRLGVEYPLSPRAPAALLTLAQLEYARGDRRAAQRHFERLLLDHPRGAHVAKANYWSGRLAIDDGDVRRGCGYLTAARATVATDDVELLNQLEYHLARCAVAAADTASAQADSMAGRRTSPNEDPTATGKEVSVQAGAYDTRREAAALAARLNERGLDARVTGSRAPFRVRVGRFGTREEAAATLRQVRRISPRAIIVDAEPR